MFRLAVIVISLIGVIAFLVLGALTVITWEVSSIMVTVFIGIAGLVLAYSPLKEKRTMKEVQTSDKIPPKQTEMQKPRIIVEETNVIGRGEYLSYDLGEQGMEEIKGEISSNEPVDFYFLTKYSLNKFEEDEDFSYEYGSESSVKSNVSYTPSRTGTWYLVIENVGKKQAIVHVRLYA